MPALHFYLNGLDTSANAMLADLSGNDTINFADDADASAQMNVDLALLKSIFRFQTDSIDVDNVVSTDTTYKVVDPTTNWTASPADATLYANAIVSDAALNQIQHDWLRYVANHIFGTHLGVDLFVNEEEVRSDLVTKSLDAIRSRFTALAALEVLTDDDVLDGTVQINPSRQILRQITVSDSTRLDELGSADEDGFFDMPLRANDELYFIFTAKADTNQNDIVAGSTVPADRKYLIKMIATAAV
jgi:hypothetical protein